LERSGRGKALTKVLLTAAQVARIFQMSKSPIYIMAKKEILPPVQFGRFIGFDEDEIAACIQAYKTFTTGERSRHG
jgi:predicted DNA-binding transcriptional regulator AlpA